MSGTLVCSPNLRGVRRERGGERKSKVPVHDYLVFYCRGSGGGGGFFVENGDPALCIPVLTSCIVWKCLVYLHAHPFSHCVYQRLGLM